MNQSLTLPMADKFYHDKRTSAFIRSVNVSIMACCAALT